MLAYIPAAANLKTIYVSKRYCETKTITPNHINKKKARLPSVVYISGLL
jgi:hypothetical protein